MKIRVKIHVNSYAGIEKETSSQEKEQILSIGDELKSEYFGGFIGATLVMAGPNLKVENITDDGIDIITNGLILKNPNGTINLMKESHGLKYRINIGETLELHTQSMDSGFVVYITPLEIIKE